MRNVWAIYRREMYSYFTSPIAYVVIAFFLFLYGYFFTDYLYRFRMYGFQMAQYGGARSINVNQDLIRWLFHSTSVLVLFMLPLVTMRTLSEEKRSGTIELLLTSPLTDFQIVFGKFLASLSLYGVMIGATLLHMGLLFRYGNPEWKPLLAGYLGMLLLGGAFIALGLLFSSFTKNQIVAAFLSFGVFLFLWLIEYMKDWVGAGFGDFVTYLSVTKHIEEFAKGVIDTKDVIYYLTFIGFGLFLSKQSVEAQRWRG
jgi:ABC-2 type transport system permease protein